MPKTPRTKVILLALLLVAVFGIAVYSIAMKGKNASTQSPSGNSPVGPASPLPGTPAAPADEARLKADRQILVKYRAGADQARLQQLFRDAGATEINEIANLRIKVLQVDPLRREAVISKLQADADIEYAEADSAQYDDAGNDANQ